MGKNKNIRVLTTIECTICRQYQKNNSMPSKLRSKAQPQPGVSRYITEKNRRNTLDRLELKKYCKYCNAKTIHREIK